MTRSNSATITRVAPIGDHHESRDCPFSLLVPHIEDDFVAIRLDLRRTIERHPHEIRVDCPPQDAPEQDDPGHHDVHGRRDEYTVPHDLTVDADGSVWTIFHVSPNDGVTSTGISLGRYDEVDAFIGPFVPLRLEACDLLLTID